VNQGFAITGLSDATAMVGAWVGEEFGRVLQFPHDPTERALRVLEEALELAQACGVTPQQARGLADHVFAKPLGMVSQEAAQVLICLLALAHATQLSLEYAFRAEWRRIMDQPPGHFAERMRRKIEEGRAVETRAKDGVRSREFTKEEVRAMLDREDAENGAVPFPFPTQVASVTSSTPVSFKEVPDAYQQAALDAQAAAAELTKRLQVAKDLGIDLTLCFRTDEPPTVGYARNAYEVTVTEASVTSVRNLLP